MAEYDEQARLRALHRYAILDTPPDASFDRITRLAARWFDVPIALVTLVDEERQWFKACIGMNERETDREIAFCAYNLFDDAVMVVEDATEDERFADNPLVTGDPGIRFYAGAPLVTEGGHVLGSLCILDTAPRTLAPEEQETLRDLAQIVMDELDLHVASTRRRDVLESITDAFFAVDTGWRFTYVNQQAEELLGRARDELLGQNVWEEFPEAVDLPFYEQYHRAMRTDESVQFEAYFPPLETWFRVNAYPFEGGLSVYFNDITAEKEKREELRLMSRAVEDTAEAVVITEGAPLDDPGPRIEYVNPAFEQMTGYSAEEVIGKTPRLLQGPDTDRAVLDVIRSHLQAGERLTDVTAINYRKDGTPFWLEWSISPVYGSDGTVQHWVAVQRDITEQRALEEALREREELLASINRHISEGLYRSNPGDGLIYVNAAFARLFGYEQPDDLLALDDVSVLYAQPAQREMLVDKVHAEGTFTNEQVQFRRADGSTFWGLLSATVVRDERGRVVHHDGAVMDITERVEAEQALREREEYLSVTLNAIGDAFIATDPDGRVKEMNAVAEQLTGWALAEARGKPLSTIFPIHNAQTGAPVENPVDKVMRQGTIVGMANHTVLTARDGTERQIADSAAPIRTEEGTLLGVVLIFRDVTEAYRRREALKHEREQLALALDAGDLGVWDWDLTTGAVEYDARWAEMLGHTVDEIAPHYKSWVKRVHPDDMPEVQEVLKKHLAGETPAYETVHRMRHKDESWRWIFDRGKVIERAADGTPLRAIGVHQDITERKEIEEALRHSRARLTRAQEITHLGSWEHDYVHDELHWSDETYRIFGWEPGTPVDVERFMAAVHPEDRAALRQQQAQVFAGEAPLDIEYRIQRADGDERIIHERGEADVDEDGAVIRVTGTVLDVTEWRAMEAALREREERVQGLYHAMSALTRSETPEELARGVHDLVTDTLGYSSCVVRYREDDWLVPVVKSEQAEALMGPRPRYRVDGASSVARVYRQGETLIMDDVAHAGGQVQAAGAIRSAAYVSISHHGTVSVGHVEPGGIDLFDVKLLDILAHNAASVLERIEREAALDVAREQAEEMNRLKSAFLANMSHEIRTPLTSIIGFSEVLKDLDLNESAKQFTQLIHRGGQRLLETLNSVLDLSQLEAGSMQLSPAPTDVRDEVRATVDFFAPRAREKDITVEVAVPEAPLRVRLDSAALRRVLNNLLSNAIKFTPAGGQVTVQLRAAPEAMILSVEDTGVGIGEAFLPHLFDAFQQESTGNARMHEGSGLGLAITRQLVELMGGTIAVETEKDAGTRFIVRVPRAEDDSAAPDA